MNHDDSSNVAKEYRKFYALNIAIVAEAAVLAWLFTDFEWMDMMRMYMGVAFTTYAGFQLAGYKTFVHSFMDYDLIAAKIKAYAYAYPFIGLIWGVAYFANIAPTVRDASVLILMGIGLVGVARTLNTGKRIANCACLGSIIQLPLSRIALFEDATMAAMAAIMLAFAA